MGQGNSLGHVPGVDAAFIWILAMFCDNGEFATAVDTVLYRGNEDFRNKGLEVARAIIAVC